MPDMILLDIDLPDISGFAIVKLLYDNADARSIPVVIMSGRSQMGEVSDLSPNVKQYLEKPVEMESLLSVIQGALRPSG